MCFRVFPCFGIVSATDYSHVRYQQNTCVFSLPAAKVELLDNVTDFLEPVQVLVANSGGIGDNEESGAFKQDNLVCLACAAEAVKVGLQHPDIGY